METGTPEVSRQTGKEGMCWDKDIMEGQGRPKNGLCSSKGTCRGHTNHQKHQECVGERDNSIIKFHGGSSHATRGEEATKV